MCICSNNLSLVHESANNALHDEFESRSEKGHTMANVTDIRANGATLSQRISEVRAALADRYAKYSTYKTTLNELAGLNDRDLADLGINRSMIKSIATEAAYGTN